MSAPAADSRKPLRAALGASKKAGRVLLKVVKETAVRFYRSDGFRMASSLSFQTLVSIVPALLFLLWTIQSLHPDLGMSRISDLLSTYFFPESLKDVTETIETIIGKINFTALGWIGAAAAFLATFGLSMNAKGALDRIFNIKESKLPFMKRLFVAMIVVIIFPLYVWVTFRETRLYIHLPSALYILRPYLMTILTLYLVYRYLPEVPPRAWSALIGSVLAGIFLEGERMGLALYFSAMNGLYRIVYGALFLLPLFLLWLYLSWIVVLMGATFSSVIEKLLYEKGDRA